MKKSLLLITAGISTIIAAITAKAASDYFSDKSKYADRVLDAYTTLTARRDYLQNYNPYADELEKGAAMLDDLIDSMIYEDDRKTLTDIRTNIQYRTNAYETKRNQLMHRNFEFYDDPNFIGRINEYDVEKLKTLLRSINDCIADIEACIREIGDASVSNYDAYRLAQIIHDT